MILLSNFYYSLNRVLSGWNCLPFSRSIRLFGYIDILLHKLDINFQGTWDLSKLIRLISTFSQQKYQTIPHRDQGGMRKQTGGKPPSASSPSCPHVWNLQNEARRPLQSSSHTGFLLPSLAEAPEGPHTAGGAALNCSAEGQVVPSGADTRACHVLRRTGRFSRTRTAFSFLVALYVSRLFTGKFSSTQS